jgi:hypothetical protein
MLHEMLKGIEVRIPSARFSIFEVDKMIEGLEYTCVV